MKRSGMKLYRIITCALTMALLTMLCSCTNCEHMYNGVVNKTATCIETGIKTYTCQLCGDSYTEELALNGVHNFTSKVIKEATTEEEGKKIHTCSLCGNTYDESIPKIKSDWEIDYYVDDFGDKTSDSYIVGTFYGTFSNSATTNSDLTVFVYLDKSGSIASFRLIEYGWSKATFLSTDTITLKVKFPSGDVKSYDLIDIDGDLYSSGSGLVNKILISENISCVITAEGKYSTDHTYRFTVNNIGLKNLYDKMKGNR